MLSKRKRATFMVVIVVAIGVISELTSLVAIWFFHGSMRLLVSHRQCLTTQEPTEPLGLEPLPIMIHPYVGTVLPPKVGRESEESSMFVTPFGFMDDASPIHRRSSDRVIVAILGGSVAMQMAMNASERIRQELSKRPKYADKQFRFVRLAVNGFKQPQQLMAVNYLLSLGAEFDVVINLDGVNEAALAQIDNVPFGVAAVYPRKWGALIASAGSLQANRMIGLATYLRDQQRRLAETFNTFPLQISPTCCLMWHVLDDRYEQSIRRQAEGFARLAEKELSYGASGPPESFASDQELFEHCTDIWSRSSILLNSVCEGHGARYFHFLQPNQYVPDSKPIGATEAKEAVDQASPFRVPVRECYPLMQAKAGELRRAGVDFTDLTAVFAEHSEILYVDDCCHVNHSGDDILATAIGRHIQNQLELNP